MNKSKSRSVIEAAKAYQDIEAGMRATYPSAVNARRRSELVACVLDSVTHALAGLLKLMSMARMKNDGSSNAVPIDQPVVQLREFCRALVVAVCDMPHVAEAAPQLTAFRLQLEKAPEPGCELADASFILLWVAQQYLTILLQVEVSNVTGLPCEEAEDHVDEAARSLIPGAESDTALTRMKQQMDEDSDCDPDAFQSLRQDIRRRRLRTEKYIARDWDTFRKQIEDAAQTLLSLHQPDSPEAARIASIRDALTNPEDPSTIRDFKRWFSLGSLLGLLEDDDIPLRDSGSEVGPGDVATE